jgi:hypothetical protein
VITALGVIVYLAIGVTFARWVEAFNKRRHGEDYDVSSGAFVLIATTYPLWLTLLAPLAIYEKWIRR